ncbi:MAG: nuclear transport factor 2 family protein [Herminiimonas sp.]|nr:nuclear transport factor 2 family protein [Herminiimonas sp.]
MPKIKQIFATADATEAAFYDALARADLEALMALWADEDEIVCIHPGAPRLVGHAAIRTSWEGIFTHGSVHIKAVQRHAVQSTMSAIHNVVEEISSDSGQAERHVLATNVYLKTAAGWRIMLHHASVAPGPAPVDTTPATLH